MAIAHWLRAALAPHPAARKRPTTRRLSFEPLEDRSTPSTGGLLDPTFGSDGIVTSSFSNNYDAAHAVTTQPDGKIVAAGSTLASRSRTGSDVLVARYNGDGTLDTGFGTGGRVVTDFRGYDDGASAVATQADGKIIAAGTTTSGIQRGGSGTKDDFGLVRYTATGALDTTFGSKGKVTTDLGGYVDSLTAMAVYGDESGRILVAGYTNATGSGYTAALARYTATGALDTTFGNGGKLVTNIPVQGVGAVALQADGRIIIAGTVVDSATSSPEFLMARFNANGTADTSFGSGGVVTSQVGTHDNFGGLTIDGSGRILVAGWDTGFAYNTGYYLMRYNPDGSLDTDFGSAGVANPKDPQGWWITSGREVVGVAVQTDGQIVVVGDLYDGNLHHNVAVRVSATGALDTGYGDGGWASSQFGYGQPQAMTLQANGRLVVAGYARATVDSTAPTDITLVRFLGSAPQVGPLAATPNPAAAGSPVALTVGTVADGNAGATVTEVDFYMLNADGTQTLLGTGTRNADGTWSLTLDTTGWAAGSYTLLAQATDSYGAVGDPSSLSLQLT